MDPVALRALVEQRARELGFVRCGVASVTPLEREAEALERWLKRGDHGSMRWMEDTADVRVDPSNEKMLAGARSVMVFVTPYARAGGEASGPEPGVIARYARGRDYHNVVGKRMRKLARILRDSGARVRASIDTLPVLERAWAQRAGVGFIGKNCCLIVPGVGSHAFLSALITDAELPADTPMQERCGSCRLCLDGCPTRAFVEPRALDSRRCISYLTIEHEGSIGEDLRAPMGAHLFGCDDCQDVCPFNKTAPAAPELTLPFASDPRLATPADALLRMGEAAFEAWAHASPLQRPGRDGMARNAAIVLGNVGDRRHLPVLREAASTDPSDVVREAAAWALARLDEREGS